MLAPVIPQDCTATTPIFGRPIVGPGMHFEFAFSFGAMIAKNIMRPPAFEIATSPNGNVSDMWKIESAIDPTAAAPFWRTHVPVRMIIE